MQKLGMCALGVGQGSIRESQIAIMRWTDRPTERPCVHRQGVTFDTGGISLAGMQDMKWDMGGAARSPD